MAIHGTVKLLVQTETLNFQMKLKFSLDSRFFAEIQYCLSLPPLSASKKQLIINLRSSETCSFQPRKDERDFD